MGREIRRVPANWEHPTDADGNYRPLYEGGEEAYRRDMREWEASVEEYGLQDSWQEPTPDEFMPGGDWYQLFETVSEGTPLSPPFETPEELIDWLTNNRDYWGRKWSRESAEGIVRTGWAPSMLGIPGVGLLMPEDQPYPNKEKD